MQSRTINSAMAEIVNSYVYRLLISRDLNLMATHLDQRAMMMHKVTRLE